MPADDAVPFTPRIVGPYQCYNQPLAPVPDWAINYGTCRHGLDAESRIHDLRCPADCTNRAPACVAAEFNRIFKKDGAIAGAEYVRKELQNEGS